MTHTRAWSTIWSMLEMETRIRPESLQAQSTLQKVDRFALGDERYRNLRADLQSIAVQKAAFFLDASDEVVHQRARSLYEKELEEKELIEKRSSINDEQYVSHLGNIYGKFADDSFDRREKKTWAGGFYEMYDHYLDSWTVEEQAGVTKQGAHEGWQKEFRIEIARREARLAFAKAMHYAPGDRQKDSYEGIVGDHDFINASDLVTVSMLKFGS